MPEGPAPLTPEERRRAALEALRARAPRDDRLMRWFIIAFVVLEAIGIAAFIYITLRDRAAYGPRP